MSVFDIIVLIILFYFSLKGFVKGMVKEFISTFTFFIVIYSILNYLSQAEEFLKTFIYLENLYLKILSFFFIIVIVLVILKLIDFVLSKLIESSPLSFFNKILGLLIGFLKGSLIVFVLFYIVRFLDYNQKIIKIDLKAKSVLYPYIENYSKIIFPFLKQWLE